MADGLSHSSAITNPRDHFRRVYMNAIVSGETPASADSIARQGLENAGHRTKPAELAEWLKELEAEVANPETQAALAMGAGAAAKTRSIVAKARGSSTERLAALEAGLVAGRITHAEFEEGAQGLIRELETERDGYRIREELVAKAAREPLTDRSMLSKYDRERLQDEEARFDVTKRLEVKKILASGMNASDKIDSLAQQYALPKESLMAARARVYSAYPKLYEEIRNRR